MLAMVHGGQDLLEGQRRDRPGPLALEERVRGLGLGLRVGLRVVVQGDDVLVGQTAAVPVPVSVVRPVAKGGRMRAVVSAPGAAVVVTIAVAVTVDIALPLARGSRNGLAIAHHAEDLHSIGGLPRLAAAGNVSSALSLHDTSD